MTFPRGSSLLAIVAILSVALNLFLAGSQLGHQFRGPAQPMNFQQRLTGVLRELPEADQPIARGVLDSHMSDIIEKWRASRPANQRAALAMHADPFDADEARAAFDKANQRTEEVRKALQAAMIELAQKVSPEGREKLRVPGAGF